MKHELELWSRILFFHKYNSIFFIGRAENDHKNQFLQDSDLKGLIHIMLRLIISSLNETIYFS